MTVRSSVLGRAHLAAAGNVNFATVPATHTWICKELRGYNSGGVATSITVSVTGPDSTVVYLLVNSNVNAGASFTITPSTLYFIADAGTVFNFQSSAAPASVWLSGSDLLAT